MTSLSSVLVAAALVVTVALIIQPSQATNFTLTVKKDSRRVIDLGVFGYAANGKLFFELKDFFLHDMDEYATATEKIGFTLDKVVSASFARQERAHAIKETKKDMGEDKDNVCFVDDSAVSPLKRFNIPLQEALNQAMTKYEHKSAQGSDTAAAADAAAPAAPISKEAVQRQANELRGSLSGLSTTITIPEGAEGLYALFFYNCKKANKNKDPAHVSFKVAVSQYNVIKGSIGSDEEERNYLSVGEYPLSFMYTITALIFGGGLFYWHRVLYHSGPEVARNVRSIHHLMYLLVVLKVITLVLHVVVLTYRSSTGRMSAGLDYLFYFFQTVKGVALFTVIVLLGTGWSILKPFLSDRDRKLLLAILPLQILANIALAVIEEQSEGSKSWAQWRDALRLFDVACCCAVLLPVVWSIRSMKDGSSASKATQRSLARLKQFRTFYVAAVMFIYFTRIVIEFIGEYLPYTATWVAAFLYEVAAVLFYAFVARQFRPTAESILRAMGNDEDDGVDDDEGTEGGSARKGGKRGGDAESERFVVVGTGANDDVEDIELEDDNEAAGAAVVANK
ncbi:membrane-associated protein, putative [Bodo saltans]|uniref:Membrane-associated protein, putative n=1 Tax=Bodo saltans TaxID=75058 RepID=A0A0S4IT40_BODSA|nr:membrane-associated protein, putative [Bodo saltans]|eukprot:CUE99405.1 membrane-associated protein, putative [Bodo saltans]